jgi:hypothetical protein
LHMRLRGTSGTFRRSAAAMKATRNFCRIAL